MINLRPHQVAACLTLSFAGYNYKKKGSFKKIQDKINPICIPFSFFESKTDPEYSISTILKKIEEDFNDSKNITIHVEELKKILQEEEGDDQVDLMAIKIKEFIVSKRKNDNMDILVNSLFYRIHPVSRSFSEIDCNKLLGLEPLFLFFNDHLCRIQDKKLRQDIKILFANLPYSSNRQDLPHLYLDQREQLEIILIELQKQEDLLVQEVIDRLESKNSYISEMELSFIQKIVSPKKKMDSFSTLAQLSPSNRAKFNKVLGGYSPIPIHPIFLKMIQQYSDFKKEYLTELPESSLKILQRVLKSKSFFQNQLDLPDDQIRIPYWFHATNDSNIKGLMTSKIIKVSQKRGDQQGYTGAWVSSAVESRLFGKYLIGLSRNIEELNNGIIRKSILFLNKRWRGLLVSIPIDDYASVFTVPTIQDKSKQKEKKRQVAQWISEDTASSYPYKIMSEKQLFFMQKQITTTLGHPNLPLSYWKWRP